ncbi:MAG: DNA recombination protein RmuC [Oscillospiraceae bacterium]
MEYIIVALLGVVIVLNVVLLTKKGEKEQMTRELDALRQDFKEYTDKSQKDMLDFVARQMTVQSQNQSTMQNLEAARFKEFSDSTQSNIEVLRRTVGQMAQGLDDRFVAFQKQNDTKLSEMRLTIEQKVTSMQESNEKKLDEMRQTVDEKLQKTLEERISQSFKLVSDRLQQVYEGLGEMKTLANGVGDLKKVLSNVKTRGILGEVQLGAILEQILNNDQYDTNVATKKDSADRVEFAVKLPGQEGEYVYLPIDAKFPLDAYNDLVNAYDTGDAKVVEDAAKVLTNRVKAFAKDIRTKYIDVPHTTDFAIMFLPIEGLYAEVVRRGLIEVLQNEYKVNIAGPTTMAALLNSLQMGFKTLAIQKRSGEVWEILGGVKQEFDKFENVLISAQKRMTQVSGDLESLIGTRTRAIQRKLRTVTDTISDGERAKLSENAEKTIDTDL